jgi:hypothetical protein
MHVLNLRHACGHWQEWLLPCGWATDPVYAAPLAEEPCPRCAGRLSARRLARDLLSEYHRTLCSRAPPRLEALPARFHRCQVGSRPPAGRERRRQPAHAAMQAGN